MRPWKTLKGTLVHPKDKPDKEDITECVYKVPCANCDKTYEGETGRKLGVKTWRTQDRMWIKDQTGIHKKPAHCQFSRDQQIHSNRPCKPGDWRITWSTGPRQQWLTESQTILPGWSRKVHNPWIAMKAAINSSHTYDRFVCTSSSSSHHTKNRKN